MPLLSRCKFAFVTVACNLKTVWFFIFNKQYRSKEVKPEVQDSCFKKIKILCLSVNLSKLFQCINIDTSLSSTTRNIEKYYVYSYFKFKYINQI